MKKEQHIIEIKNLKFAYKNKKILNGIELKIKRNKLTGILGPNGCGKTTLLKNILGYLKPDSGNIILNQKDTNKYTQKDRARLISFVPQKSQLFTNMNIFDFVIMGRLPHLKNKWNGYSNEDKEITYTYLEELELIKFKDRSAITLSGGEFQRVLLARALTQKPEIILLDEPTSALDLNYALEFMNKIKIAVKNENLTAVIVLHDLNLASMFCDEIIMLKDGKVFAQGTPKQVITKNNLKEIYQLKSDIIFLEDDTPYVIPKLKTNNERKK